jgi:hypothetical protein
MKRLRTWRLPAALPKPKLPGLFKPIAAGAMLAGMLLGGCERLAGTEVGNPEITVAARFAIRDTSASSSIQEMDLKVMGMGWQAPEHHGDIWAEPDGFMIDFASATKAALPSVIMQDGDFSGAELLLQAAEGQPTLPDSVGFEEWSDPRYIKLAKVMGQDTVRALFQLEAGMRITLGFAPATIRKWREDGKLMVSVLFDADKWLAGMGSNPDFAYREDGKHARYVRLSPDENTDTYAALKTLLPASFMADTATMR